MAGIGGSEGDWGRLRWNRAWFYESRRSSGGF
jgi:hypothetical protein